MIVSFKDRQTRVLFETGKSRRLGKNVMRAAVRKLTQIDQVERLDDLRIPPGNCLESLKGDRKGQHSIRINDQFRVCFKWLEDGVHDVEITDYH